MSAKPKFTKRQISDAIKGSLGVKTVAIQKLKCDRKTFDQYLRRWPELKAQLDDEREEYKDLIEYKARSILLDENDKTMCIFLLKTLCRDRGYGESVRLETKPDGSGVIVLRPEEVTAIFGDGKQRPQAVRSGKQK